MKLWILSLRLLGAAILLWSVVGGLVKAGNSAFITDPYYQVQSIIEALVLAFLCFGGAAALRTLHRIDQRGAQQNAALRRLLPKDAKQEFRDLAPHAPTNWSEFEPHPIVSIGHEKKLVRRKRLGTVDDVDMFGAKLKRKHGQ